MECYYVIIHIYHLLSDMCHKIGFQLKMVFAPLSGLAADTG